MDNNDLRLYANEIMRRLYIDGEREQLEILRLYAARCIEEIDAKAAQSPAPSSAQKGGGL